MGQQLLANTDEQGRDTVYGTRKCRPGRKISRKKKIGWTAELPVRSILCQTVEFPLDSFKPDPDEDYSKKPCI
jgi:hypothetical protein